MRKTFLTHKNAYYRIINKGSGDTLLKEKKYEKTNLSI